MKTDCLKIMTFLIFLVLSHSFFGCSDASIVQDEPVVIADDNDVTKEIELEILNSDENYGTNPIAFVGGNAHRITLRSKKENVSQHRPIQVGGMLHIARPLDVATPDAISAVSSTLINTEFPVLLTDVSSGNNIFSIGDVTNNWTANTIMQTGYN